MHYVIKERVVELIICWCSKLHKSSFVSPLSLHIHHHSTRNIVQKIHHEIDKLRQILLSQNNGSAFNSHSYHQWYNDEGVELVDHPGRHLAHK